MNCEEEIVGKRADPAFLQRNSEIESLHESYTKFKLIILVACESFLT